MARPIGSKQRLREHFLANVGRIMDSRELRGVAGVSEWARRVRELRDEDGWQIVTDSDRQDLRPGQYLMVSAEQGTEAVRRISKETRAKVIEQYGSICYDCGAVAGEAHLHDGRPTRLQMGHIVAKSHGGDDSASNLRPLCTVCNTGASNISAELPTDKRLIAQLRRAPEAVQMTVYDWLKAKFSRKLGNL